MFLPPMERVEEMIESDYNCFERGLTACLDILIDLSGPLPPGNKFIEPIQDYLDLCAALRHNNDGEPAARIIAEKFRTLHAGNGPPSLKSMCRLHDQWLLSNE